VVGLTSSAAGFYQHQEVIALLLCYGADPHFTNKFGIAARADARGLALDVYNTFAASVWIIKSHSSPF
jgi:hypothetical protein